MVGMGYGHVNSALGLVAVVILIIANGFFVAAEFALVAVDLDDGADGLGLRAGDGFGVLGLELDLPDQSFGIEAPTFDQVGFLESGLPFLRQGHKPPLQGFRGVGAIGRTRGRHRRNRIKPAPFSPYNPQTLPILSKDRSGFGWVWAC